MSTSTATLMDHDHGVPNNRCTHPDCQAAYLRWGKQYRLDKHRGLARTLDADQARRHLALLEGAGWSRRSIAAAAGISATAISRIAHGQKTVRRTVLDRLLAVDPTTYPTRPHRRSDDVFVPRVGTVRRIQALLALGWTHAHISEHTGLRSAVLLSQQGRWVSRTTHDKVATTYRRLSTRTGPSEHTRRRAARLGYLTPLAWDDIDTDPEPDLDHHPATHDDNHDDVDEIAVLRILNGDLVPTTTAERRQVVARWIADGRSLSELARLTGWKPERYYQPAQRREAS